MRKFPKIKIVRSVWGSTYSWCAVYLGKGKGWGWKIDGPPPAKYNPFTNIITLDPRARWAIVHELLHWVAFLCGDREHWLNRWLDNPNAYKRVGLLGF